MLYFDHNATTFLAPEVADTLMEVMRKAYGNPSSVHRQGQIARQELERARSIIAEYLGALPQEFIFTSGGTEANNLAIHGLLRALPQKRRHIITSVIEHPAVLEPFRDWEDHGTAVTYIGVDSGGRVDPAEIAKAVCDETVLISVMHANNEVGTIQPLTAIADLVAWRRSMGQEIFLHADGVQAFGKTSVNVRQLGVDLYSVSGHKIFAPKGIGGLFVRKGVPLQSILLGGRHERNRRAGTENVPAAAAFARAVQLCQPSDEKTVAMLRDELEHHLQVQGVCFEVNGDRDTRLSNTTNLLFPGISAEALTIALDIKGMALSTGAACSSGSVEPSHVLLAMGRKQNEARSSVRVSLGRYNTAEEVKALAEAITSVTARLQHSSKEKKQFVV